MTFVWTPGMVRTAVWFAVAAFLGAGCATIQRYEITETERMLAEAGFQRRPEDLRSIPPHRIVSRIKDGNVEYTYADPDNCRCVWAGGEKEYSEYERLRLTLVQRASGSSPSGGARGGAP